MTRLHNYITELKNCQKMENTDQKRKILGYVVLARLHNPT